MTGLFFAMTFSVYILKGLKDGSIMWDQLITWKIDLSAIMRAGNVLTYHRVVLSLKQHIFITKAAHQNIVDRDLNESYTDKT